MKTQEAITYRLNELIEENHLAIMLRLVDKGVEQPEVQ